MRRFTVGPSLSFFFSCSVSSFMVMACGGQFAAQIPHPTHFFGLNCTLACVILVSGAAIQFGIFTL